MIQDLIQQHKNILDQLEFQLSEVRSLRLLSEGSEAENIIEQYALPKPFADRFEKNIELPEQMTEQLLENVNFELGLGRWEIGFGIDNVGSIRLCELVDDEDTQSKVIQFNRRESMNDGSSVGLAQDVCIDLSKYDDVRLCLDVKPIFQTLPGTGIAGNECPVMLEVAFIDQRGEPHIWTHGFYYIGDDRFDSVTRVEQGKWFTYTSPNLKEIKPVCANTSRVDDILRWGLKMHKYNQPVIPAYITRILVYGSGWDFTSRTDNIKLVVTSTQ